MDGVCEGDCDSVWMECVITIKWSVEGICQGECGSGSKVCAKGNVNLEGIYVKGNVTVCGRNV